MAVMKKVTGWVGWVWQSRQPYKRMLAGTTNQPSKRVRSSLSKSGRILSLRKGFPAIWYSKHA